MDASPLSVRSVDVAWLEGVAAALHGEFDGHGGRSIGNRAPMIEEFFPSKGS